MIHDLGSEVSGGCMVHANGTLTFGIRDEANCTSLPSYPYRRICSCIQLYAAPTASPVIIPGVQNNFNVLGIHLRGV